MNTLLFKMRDHAAVSAVLDTLEQLPALATVGRVFPGSAIPDLALTYFAELSDAEPLGVVATKLRHIDGIINVEIPPIRKMARKQAF